MSVACRSRSVLRTSRPCALSLEEETKDYYYCTRLPRKKDISQFNMWDTPSLAELQKALGDPSNPIGMRMRAAYHLRHVHDKAENENDQILVVEALSKGLLDPRHGSLMRHEFAYVMGQLKDKRVRPLTISVTITNDY